MLGSRFLWKLFAGYAVVIVVTALLIGVLVGRNAASDQRELISQSLESDVYLLRELARPYFQSSEIDSSFQQRLWRLGQRTQTRYTVLLANGAVVADSHEDPSVMDNHGRRPEVLEALARGLGSSSRYSETVGHDMLYMAVAVEDGGDVTGFVRAAVPLSYVAERLVSLRRLVTVAALGGVLFALIIGLVMARNFTMPLRRITEVASAVAAGDYGRTIALERNDEVGVLADTFDTMTAQLRNHIDTITADRNKTEAILAGMVEGVIAIDRDERIVHINSAAEAILGVSSSDAMGKRIWEATRVREASDALSAAMQEQETNIAEARIASPDKDQVVQLIATPLRSGAGELEGAILVLHDVSELRKLEKIRSDFITNVSHELKTPLAAIRGLVETMIDDRDMDDETHSRFLVRVHEQSARLGALVVDLLAISRLEADEGGVQFEPVDLREPVAEAFRTLAPVADNEQLELKAEVPDTAVPIRGDAETLRELAENLVGNAIKYTPRGGKVRVRLAVEGALAVLEVEDTGIGIAPEHQGRVFERFYRVDKARSRQLGGTGLGLSIVKHVALAHGGNVSLRSAPGEGSTFRVQFPLDGNVQAGPHVTG